MFFCGMLPRYIECARERLHYHGIALKQPTQKSYKIFGSIYFTLLCLDLFATTSLQFLWKGTYTRRHNRTGSLLVNTLYYRCRYPLRQKYIIGTLHVN